MGMMDKFRNFMGMDDEFDDEFEDFEEYETPRSRSRRERDEIDDEPAPPPRRRREPVPIPDDSFAPELDSSGKQRPNKVVNIAATAQLAVVLVKPEVFDDAPTIADHLNAKRTVVLNLESTDKNVSRRLVDFLSGVAYANQGQIKRVANSTFIITPYNVDFMGDLLDELESSGVYF